MIIKVNKNQFLDEHEVDMLLMAKQRYDTISHGSLSSLFNFETEDVTLETLLDYINKGYGIKINCNY